MTLLKITEGMTVFLMHCWNINYAKNILQIYKKICFKHSKKFISGMLKWKKLCKNYDNVKNNIFQFDLTSLWFSNYWRTSNQNICQISNTHTLNVPVQISFLEYINPKKKSYWIIKPLHQIYSLNNISKIVIFLPH